MKKRIVITGAAGFVGMHMVPYLIQEGYAVTALVKNKSEKKKIPLESKVMVVNLSKKGDWQRELKGNDLIVHLAAQISAKTSTPFIKNNVVATKNLIRAAKLSKISQIVLFSSAAVTSIRLDAYAQTKKEKEEIVKKSKLKYAIIRPSMIYGPGDNKNVGWLIAIVKKLPIIPLPGGGNFGRQPLYVMDICKIVGKIAARKLDNKIYEIHGFEYITMKKMVKTIKKALGSNKISISVPIIFLFFAIKIAEIIFSKPKFTTDQIISLTSGEKFKGEAWWLSFDIIPTRFEAGVAKMIKK